MAYADFKFKKSNNKKNLSFPITWVTNDYLDELDTEKETSILSTAAKYNKNVVNKDVKGKKIMGESKMKKTMLPKQTEVLKSDLLIHKRTEDHNLEDIGTSMKIQSKSELNLDGAKENVDDVIDESDLKGNEIGINDEGENIEIDGNTQNDTQIDLTQTDVKV